MTLEQAKNLLVKAGQTITEERRVSNDTGTMLRLDCGAVVNVWDKGSFNVQGRQKAEIETKMRAHPCCRTDLLEGFSPNMFSLLSLQKSCLYRSVSCSSPSNPE